jgi:hypothetical protein
MDSAVGAATTVTTDFLSLEGIISYDVAVDLVMQMQRGIKEKVAWLEWVGRHIRRPNIAEDIKEHLTLAADNLYMGRWINGMDKAPVLWLLEERVPCFVIHKMTPADLRGFRQEETSFRSGFVVGSEAEKLGAEKNGYKFVAQRHLSVARDPNVKLHLYTGDPSVADPESLTLSYSRYQGWTGMPGVNVEEYTIPSNDEPDAPYVPPPPLQTKFSLEPPVDSV